MNKIDRRRHYILMLDTETANIFTDSKGKLDTSNALVYDIGYAIADTRGNIYKTASYLIREIFIGEKDLMQSAYYSNKISSYWEDVKNGTRKIANFWQVRKALLEDMQEYNITEVCAHNARFDIRALNNTIRWLSKSKYRYFFRYNTVVWDTLKMAKSVMLKMPTYKAFCKDNGYLTKNNQLRATAEILYRFIKRNNQFKESHTGLEDVLIEVEILSYCFRQHKAMNKILFSKKC